MRGGFALTVPVVDALGRMPFAASALLDVIDPSTPMVNAATRVLIAAFESRRLVGTNVCIECPLGVFFRCWQSRELRLLRLSFPGRWRPRRRSSAMAAMIARLRGGTYAGIQTSHGLVAVKALVSFPLHNRRWEDLSLLAMVADGR